MNFKPPELIKPKTRDREYARIVAGLDARLQEAKQKGETQLVVAHFSAFPYPGRQNLSDELKKKAESDGNFYAAWRNKSIQAEDVVRGMKGDLKLVYDYCVSKNLNPKIDHWTEGSGQEEGFQIVIKL